MYWKIHPEMLDEIRAGGTPHMPISEQLHGGAYHPTTGTP